jgi:Na+/melibiose symporter-like transporter
MSWSQTTSWVLVIVGLVAVIVGLVSPGRATVGRFSRRRFFIATGAILLVAAGVLFVAVTIFWSSRSMPV